MTGKDIEKTHEDQLQGSSDGKGIKGYLLHRAKPYLPPWLGVGGVGVASTIGHVAWAGDAGMGIGLTLGSVALTGATWWAAKSTGRERRIHSAITVAAASAWTTHAVAFGPTVVPFVVGGVVVALSWNVRQTMRRDPDGARAIASDGGLMEKVGLAKALIGKTTVEPNKVTAKIALEPGAQSNDDVTKALLNIASALDLPATAIRYQPDPDSARRGSLVIVPKDMLTETVEWDGPSLPGGSIADPLVIGRYDDGSPLRFWLPGDPEEGRNSTHILITGMTGSGKGDGALNVLTEILSRTDVVVMLSDPKSFQDFRPLLPGLDWAVEGGAPTEAMVEGIRAAIPARTRWLGQHGYRQWERAAAATQTDPKHSCQQSRACGCPGMAYMVGWFEEGAASIRYMGDEGFTEIAQLARAAGISFVLSMQRASHDQMSTTTRASLPSRLTFGCDEKDAGFTLSDAVLDAGANPGAWGNKRPGYCYLETTGVPADRHPVPARTKRFSYDSISTMEVLASWAERNGAELDPVTTAAITGVVGKAFTARKGSTATAPVPAATEDQEQNDVELSRLDDEDRDIDPEQELGPVPAGAENVVFAAESEAPDFTPEEARAALEAILADFEQDGVMVIGPKEVMERAEEFGRSRAWVSGQFQDFLAEGRLATTSKGGRYRIVPALANA
ncbi:plasmid transfer protein TraB [Streptomyces goshikiensis]|uniref:plasmid transfer protein TraB n=1 Tax=Streptomyces goshikiensis TaxID=1942 RepID=UPI0037CED6E0